MTVRRVCVGVVAGLSRSGEGIGGFYAECGQPLTTRATRQPLSLSAATLIAESQRRAEANNVTAIGTRRVVKSTRFAQLLLLAQDIKCST